MKSYVWVIIGILVVGGIIFAVRNVKMSNLNPANNIEQTQNPESSMKTVTSSDGRVSFQVPTNWTVEETQGGQGQFGQIIQQWEVTSFVPTADGTTPPNSGMVTVQIESGGSNLSIDQLVDCGMKLTCEKVGIDSEQFIKATGTLNTGSQMQTVATFYDSNIFKMEGVATSGADQQQNMAIINQIENSIKFSNP